MALKAVATLDTFKYSPFLYALAHSHMRSGHGKTVPLPLGHGGAEAENASKAIIMMVVCTGTMKINFFTKDPQALVGGTGIIQIQVLQLISQYRACLPAWEHGIDVLFVTHESPNPYLGQVNNHCCSKDKVFRINISY